MTASTPTSARSIMSRSSASPSSFSSLGSSKRIVVADRDSARTEWPALSASLAVSRPMPLLAPMIRTVLIGSMLQISLLDARAYSTHWRGGLEYRSADQVYPGRCRRAIGELGLVEDTKV